MSALYAHLHDLNIEYISSSNWIPRVLQPSVTLHAMNFREPCPLPKRLTEIPENNACRTPQYNQTHVRHDGWNIAALDDPRRDELGEPIAPDILIDSDSDEDRACDGLVRVNRVRRGDGWKCCDLDSGTCISNNHNHLDVVSAHNIH
jgi:hypothetical protein